MNVIYQSDDELKEDEVLELYRSVDWAAAEKPRELMLSLRNSPTLITARVDGRLVGLGNAISDGYLVAYYSHLVVHPEFQRKGIGRALLERMMEPYKGFHQQSLTADGDATEFYKKLGFKRAGRTVPMWIYAGTDHD